jgi:thioredoxin-like negative regulator of GroEL
MALANRLLLTFGIIVVGLALYWAWQRWQLHRLSGRRGNAPGLETLRPGIPAILYFNTPDCLPCHTVQRPAIEELKAELDGDIQVLEVDASTQHTIADYWGVLSVPTTFIIDATGQPRQMNQGVANVEKLKRQLEMMKDQIPTAKNAKSQGPKTK